MELGLVNRYSISDLVENIVTPHYPESRQSGCLAAQYGPRRILNFFIQKRNLLSQVTHCTGRIIEILAVWGSGVQLHKRKLTVRPSCYSVMDIIWLRAQDQRKMKQIISSSLEISRSPQWPHSTVVLYSSSSLSFTLLTS